MTLNYVKHFQTKKNKMCLSLSTASYFAVQCYFGNYFLFCLSFSLEDKNAYYANGQ